MNALNEWSSALRCLRVTAALCLVGFAYATFGQGPQPLKSADKVLILKKDHLLELLSSGKVIRFSALAGSFFNCSRRKSAFIRR